MSKQYDVLMVTDCRFPGGAASSVAEEVRAQSRAGYRTGVLHVPSPRVSSSGPFVRPIREVLDQGHAELVVGSEDVEAGLLVARQPSVFSDLPDGLPRISADACVLAVNATPDATRRRMASYDVAHVNEQIERLSGTTATWAPIGPRVRAKIATHGGVIRVLDEDWENVIDTDQWQVDRTGFVADRPVLGRHTREHWSKWPTKIENLLAAYPADSGYTVQVLGGARTPERILGRIPGNWICHPYDSLPVQEFLSRIDFFVFFHHPKTEESFGRVVLEALASGAVAIVSPYMEELFGDACLYGSPHDVRDYIDGLYSDWDAYAERSRRGVELVRKRYGYDKHVERVERLIGPPSVRRHAAPKAPAAPRLRRGTVVVDLTAGAHLDPMVSSVTRAAVNEGPRVLVLPAARAAEVGGRVAVETFSRTIADLRAPDRRRYLAFRIAGIVAAHRPARLIVIDDGTEAVRDLLRTVDKETTDAWRVEPGRASEPAGDAFAEVVAKILPPGWGIAPAPQKSLVPPAVALERGLGADLRRWLRGVTRSIADAQRQRRLLRLKNRTRYSRLMLFEFEEGIAALPVRSGTAHREPKLLPISLVIVTDVYIDAERTVQAIVERQHVTAGFRVALLAPAEWEPVAAAHDLTIETLVTEPAWNTLYGSGWNEYLRQRIDEACRVIGPATVVMADGSAGAPQGLATLLDILESTRVRRRV